MPMMSLDEQAIRTLIARWLAASKRGDLDSVLGMMTDDAVFMVPGQKPFGREAFIERAEAMKGVAIDGTSEIVELHVFDEEWAWLRNRLRLTVTPPGGRAVTHSGFTMTILHKGEDGNWRLARDANMLAPEA